MHGPELAMLMKVIGKARMSPRGRGCLAALRNGDLNRNEAKLLL